MKKVGNDVYIHVSNLRKLTDKQMDLYMIGKKFLDGFEKNLKYEIIKINEKKPSISFIESSDWDTSREPKVGNSYNINEDGDIKIIKSCGKIYHHKWMFVESDYKGFDVEESKNWSTLWTEQMDEKIKPLDNSYKCKIGNEKIWNQYLKKCGLI